ncbi:hypothetical protein ACFXAZ_21075 [Streptomyces sp. NPDC059477]|uniref:hypothetical protein n=1 Tax=Streptomyces sp. NPDC059477 TaxID=3346847 RepID=UPI00369F05E6
MPPTGPSPACAGANLEGITGSGDDTGSVQAYWRGLVGPVYEAACAGDERPLSNLFLFVESHEDFMTSPCPGCTPGEIITMWLKDFGFGTEDLALLLETPPTQDQSGLTYRRGDAVTWFSRGTHDTPGGWAGLYPGCEADRRCREYLAP